MRAPAQRSRQVATGDDQPRRAVQALIAVDGLVERVDGFGKASADDQQATNVVNDGSAVLQPVEDAVEVAIRVQLPEERFRTGWIVEVDDGGGGLVDGPAPVVTVVDDRHADAEFGCGLLEPALP